MAAGIGCTGSLPEKCGSDPATEESSESEGETEPSKSFHRRISTSKALKNGVCIKEGFLMKQTSSFQRWKRRYFKLKPRKLYYAKDNKSVIFEEIDLAELSIAECSIKNVNHSFQLITPFRRLILCAESRKEMEEWISALRNVSNKDFYEGADHHEFLSGQHNWYVTSHARPTYCNICKEALSGVTSHGLSCEVCKFKAHKKCAAKAPTNCKWTTLSSVGKDIIEDEDGSITMPHQWMEGNLPVSAKCVVCDKTCGSVLRLQDWRCLWCRAMVHTACKSQYPQRCPLGLCHVSVVPPVALHNIGSDDSWEGTRPMGCYPLLVFVNSKSGDNQGVKFLRRFKQLLNPAQVFDLMNGGPDLGLKMFRTFNPFRILVCGGDGSVSWVLAELDKLNLQKQCQLGVLPLGTGNDLARVLGWGSVCDDDTQLPQMLEKYEKATVKQLDRWSIMSYEGTMPIAKKMPTDFDPISVYEDSVVAHLTKILHSDQHSVVISSAKVLCETVKDFIAKVGAAYAQQGADEEEEDSITHKCAVLNQKLDSLLQALNEESLASEAREPAQIFSEKQHIENKYDSSEKTDVGKPEKFYSDNKETPRRKKKTTFIQREALMSRANSLKKAVRQIIEHTERAVDEQNAQTKQRQAHSESDSRESFPEAGTPEECSQSNEAEPISLPVFTTTSHEVDDSNRSSHPLPPWNPWGSSMGQSVGASLKDTLQVTLPTIEGGASADSSPCPSPRPYLSLTPSPIFSPCSSPTSYRQPSESQSTFPNGSKHEMVLSLPLQSPGRTPSPSSQQDQIEEDNEKQTMTSSSGTNKKETAQSPTASRRISSGATLKHMGNIGFQLGASFGISLLPQTREKSQSPETVLPECREFPIINPLASLPMWPNLTKDSIIGKVLLANADALCAAASPLMDVDEMSLNNEVSKNVCLWLRCQSALCTAGIHGVVKRDGFEEKCVMNNYFGIGLDAKITLEFQNKREEHPEKCRSRTKNLMWYGVLGGKELLQRTFKNLEQRVQLECDGRRIPLPSLQGIVVLNIPSYGGGSNFWGGTKEDDVFYAPTFDDKILEVVAVFGTVQMAASRVINLQHHRIAQCRSVKITIMGDEGVPVQVDGEAWVQPPGYICIVHKNRTQVLCRNRQLATTQKTWQEKHRNMASSRSIQMLPLTEEESHAVANFAEIAAALVRSVKVAAISHPLVEQELFPTASQAACHMDRLFPGGRLIEGPNTRQQVTELVSSVRALYQETFSFLREKAEEASIKSDLEEKLTCSLHNVEIELKKCSEIQGMVHFHTDEEQEQKRHHKSLFKLKFKKQGKNSKADLSRSGGSGSMQVPGGSCSGSRCGTPTTESTPSDSPSVLTWGTDEVAHWLESVQLGEYRDNFIRHDIQGPELLHLERRDLKELGITKVGHIKRILQGIKDITSQSIGKKLASL